MKETEFLELYLFILIASFLYYFPGIILFFRARARPSLRSRLPTLTLVSACGLLLKNLAVCLYFVFDYKTLGSPASSWRGVYGCLVHTSVSSVLEAMIFWPLAFRFNHIHKASKIVSSFRMR